MPGRRSVRLLVNVLLAVALLGVWHVLLLRLYLDRPLLIAGWLVTVLCLVVSARSLARAVNPDERGWPERQWASLDSEGLVFVAFLLGLLFVFHWGYQRAASD